MQGGLKNPLASTCVICGKSFKKIRNNQTMCSQTCRTQSDMMRRKLNKSVNNKSPHGEVDIVPYIYKDRPVIETDEEQRAIRMAIAEKQSIYPSEVKQYVPGTPEFEAVMQTIKPVGEIRNVSALVGLTHRNKAMKWL